MSVGTSRLDSRISVSSWSREAQRQTRRITEALWIRKTRANMHELGRRILATQSHMGPGDFQVTCSIKLYRAVKSTRCDHDVQRTSSNLTLHFTLATPTTQSTVLSPVTQCCVCSYLLCRPVWLQKDLVIAVVTDLDFEDTIQHAAHHVRTRKEAQKIDWPIAQALNIGRYCWILPFEISSI